jgi:CubicO group peptidase (beta-lactamase class C family)
VRKKTRTKDTRAHEKTNENPPPPDDVTAKIDAHLSALNALDRFSGATLIGRDGTVLFAKGFGLANREHDVANTPQTRFRLASVSKQFTAVAALLLAERGKWDLHAPIRAYAPDYPSAWEGVTAHHLLNHTSGIPSYTNFLDWATTARQTLTVAEMVALFRDRRLDFPPGARHSYNNSGYILLGDLIERLSGRKYAVFLRENIFDPLGMNDSGYDSAEPVLKRRASGYARRNGDIYVNGDFLDMSVPYAAGSLYSTVEDLFRYDQAMYARDPGLLTEDSLSAMQRITPLLANYGYGIGLSNEFSRAVIGHSGGIHGFRTHLLRLRDENLCVAVLANVENADAPGIARDLLGITLGETVKTPEVPAVLAHTPDALDACAGRYEIAPHIGLTVGRDGDHLIVCTDAGVEARLFSVSDTEFVRWGTEDRVTFARSGKGKITQLILKQGGIETRVDRVK